MPSTGSISRSQYVLPCTSRYSSVSSQRSKLLCTGFTCLSRVNRGCSTTSSMVSAFWVCRARCEASRSRDVVSASSRRVRARGGACPAPVLTYNLGGNEAHTAALIVAQVQAVFFNSLSNSAGEGGRRRRKASMVPGPNHCGPTSALGADLPHSQRAMRWRIDGMEAPETEVRGQKSEVRNQVMMVIAISFLDITMRGVRIAKSVVKEFLKKNR